jgi:uncharacterized protein
MSARGEIQAIAPRGNDYSGRGLCQGHAAHDVARRWWEEQPDGTVGTCLLTRLAVLRLLTNKIAMNGMPITPDHSLQAWQQLQNDPRSLHIEAEPIDHERRFVALVSGREPTPNLWTDAWLAALALSLDYEMQRSIEGSSHFAGSSYDCLPRSRNSHSISNCAGSLPNTTARGSRSCRPTIVMDGE